MPDVAVVGAGIGGLLVAAKLSHEMDVEVYERLPIIGGRFTNLPYKGFQLTTGALHMVPYGVSGPLGHALKGIGAKVQIIKSEPPAVVRREDGSEVVIRDLKDAFEICGVSRFEQVTHLAKIALSGKRTNLVHILRSNPCLLKYAEALSGWSLSMNLDEVPASEIWAILRSTQKYGNQPGIPVGGCKAIIDAIAETIRGEIHTSSEVERILVEGKKVTGIEVGGKFVSAESVISNIGPDATNKLLGFKSISEKPSAGIKISISSDESLIGHTGILLTPFTRRIKGLNEVTNADPNLAPPGKHLIMSHQPLKSTNLTEEIQLGLNDLTDLFGNVFDILLVQSYFDGWPVNRMASGYDAPNRTQYKNLYLVGDGAKGKGGIEVEGIALGVDRVISSILK
jgi:phytoene dehydrogenase-like protein